MIDNSSLSVNNPASTSHQSALMLFFAYFELIVRLYKILESICGGGPTSACRCLSKHLNILRKRAHKQPNEKKHRQIELHVHHCDSKFTDVVIFLLQNQNMLKICLNSI